MNDHQPNSSLEISPLRKGRFYFIFEEPGFYVLTDKTKRGLEVKDRFTDEKTDIEAIRGMIYDMEGTGHKVAIKWLYPKSRYDLNSVIEDAEKNGKEIQRN